ncbi:hypothetical protein KA005_42060 [bacterium]|nr:hypothetical protein [bacterium]
MNETVSIKKENLQRAYDNGCEDVQDVLKDLFPDDLERDKFCCSNFKMYYEGTDSHPKFIFDSEIGDYYVFPDVGGWTVRHCPTCGAKYDGKEWTPRV